MAFLIKYQAIKDFFRVQSRDQGKILLIKNLDPGRGWFYSPYESDYPLQEVGRGPSIAAARHAENEDRSKRHVCLLLGLLATESSRLFKMV